MDSNNYEAYDWDEAVISILKKDWQEYFERFPIIIESLNYQLQLNERYLATAEKKRKRPDLIARRRNKNQSDIRTMHKYEIEFSHYAKIDKDIQTGIIKPYIYNTRISDGTIIGKQAYYLMEMPDGEPGIFGRFGDDDLHKGLLFVRKLNSHGYR